MNDVNVLPMLPLPCHFLTNDANLIITRLRLVQIRSEFEVGVIVFLNLKKETTVVRHSQGVGNGECYKRFAIASRALQMLPNALPKLPMACECLRKLPANDSIRNTR